MKHFLLSLLLPLLLSTASVAQDHQPSGQLVHLVFFKLKPGVDKQLLVKSLETFKTVNVIKKVQIGLWEETNNPKSVLTDYSVVVQLTFNSLADFRVYEKHPVHLASIEATKDLMAAPPIGYDCYMNSQ